MYSPLWVGDDFRHCEDDALLSEAISFSLNKVCQGTTELKRTGRLLVALF